jgi:hypothetical protein
MDTMTVREALLFAAELKLPKSMSSADKVGRGLAQALRLTRFQYPLQTM